MATSTPDLSGFTYAGPAGEQSTDTSSGDSTVAQFIDAFSTAGTTAATLIPEIEGPQQLAPGSTYVVNGKVVTTPSPTIAGLGVSPTTLMIIVVIAIVVIGLAMTHH